MEISQSGMGAHYDRLTEQVSETVKEVVPPKKPLKFNGHKASATTKRLYDLRVHDFGSGRNIKSDRAVWNETLNVAALKDYKDWENCKI